MHGITRWTPPASWYPYSSHRGPREYRHGYRGYLWAVVPAARARRLLPLLGGTVPRPRPGQPPVFYALRLDCTGRFDRVLGEPCTLREAREVCEGDARSVAAGEAREFRQTGRRPVWARTIPGRYRMITLDEKTGMAGSAPVSPVVLRTARFTWRLRRLTDTMRGTRRAHVPGGPPEGWPDLSQGAAFRAQRHHA